MRPQGWGLAPALLAILLGSGAITACGTAPSAAAAKLINAYVTKQQYSAAAFTTSPIPTTLSCGKDSYTNIKTVTDQDSTSPTPESTPGITGTATGTTADVFVVLVAQAEGPGITVPDSLNKASINCRVRATYGAQTSGSYIYLTGGGTISSCDNFSCVVDGKTISCDEMTDALSKYACQ